MGNEIHQNLAAGRWFELTIAEQLGNIGSEVGRAVKWQNKSNFESRDRALARAFDLLNLSITDKRWWGPRLRELCRLREILADTFYGNREYNDTPEALEKYFYEYALAARKNI